MSYNASKQLRRLARNDPRVALVDVTPDIVSRVAAALQGNTHIDTLRVHIRAAVDGRNELPADDVQAQWIEFCRAAQSLPSLKTLVVSTIRKEPSEEDCLFLCLLLEHTKQINKLSLRGCYDESTFPSTAVCRLARNLTELAGLEEFQIYYFRIQPTDLAHILSVLSSLAKLKRLSLRPLRHHELLIVAPMLDDTFFFVEKLLRKQSLLEFRYGNVGLSDAQADAIADIVSRNFDIPDLCFDQIGGTKSETVTNLNKKIKTIAKLNKAGRRYLAERGPECKAAGINVLSAVSDDLDCLYYHLRENPALVSDMVGKFTRDHLHENPALESDLRKCASSFWIDFAVCIIGAFFSLLCFGLTGLTSYIVVIAVTGGIFLFGPAFNRGGP